MSDVKLLAAWDGWCDPCATERPLVLVEVGPRGVKAWLGGVGIEDRTLSLTCRVCGQWQLVPQLEEDDEEMDQLRRSSFRLMLDDTWPHGVEPAVDIALLGRYYERIADHAVSVANRVVFVVTGQYPVASEA